MISAKELAREEHTMKTISQLTSAFEGIASMHIARIKDEVQESEKFFSEVWPIYTRLRVGKGFDINRAQAEKDVIDKELLIAITSENTLSGDIDHQVVSEIVKDFDPKKHDIIVLGHHGASQMRQRNIPFAASFRLPPEGQQINFDSIVQTIRRYRSTTVYYQAYITLMTQEVRKISLSRAIEALGDNLDSEDISYISDASFIFEPSVDAVLDYMEQSMLYVALNQVTLFSRLAQHASRFKAMTAARTLAQEAKTEITYQLNRLKRFIRDQRMREIINGLQKEEEL